ncbi:MAG: CcdB family protein [Curvibacter sp.]
MARFDVYVNPGEHAGTTPYLLDVQSGLLDDLDSRVVVPLRSLQHFPQVKLPARLMPVFHIHGQACLMETPKMAAIPRRVLKTVTTSLAQEQEQITAALDFLFHGY